MKNKGIYKITNPNGKIHIGQSIDLECRFKCYKYLKCKNQILFMYEGYNSI